MGLVVKAETQLSLEERAATLEMGFVHMREDIREIKVDLKALDAKFERKFDTFDVKFDKLKDSIAEMKIWMLLMMGATLAIMARAFHWI
jgi:hypothetical protein